MLRSSETESEILLGNKQLLGIFLVVALLLGIAFTGGYMVGHSSSAKKAAVTAEAAPAEVAGNSSEKSSGTGGQTHTLEGEPTQPAADETAMRSEPVLGTHKHTASKPVPSPATPAPEAPETEKSNGAVETGYAPRSGSQYLQVAAVGKDEAEAVADVLHKKGFHAHAVPKPGNPKLYRVIIGPIKDAGDLSSTRDSLRKTGFREVIVQHY